MADTSFRDYLLEQLEAFRGVSTRAMFGGFGVYKSGIMFGLISANELYFKVSDGNRADYEARKSQAFTYSARGKRVSLSYWRVPDDVLEDTELLIQWAEKALQIAREGHRGLPKPRRSGPRRPPRRN